MGGGGLVQAVDDDGVSYLAVWPHPRYAEACAVGDWGGTGPVAIEMHDWVVAILPRLAEEGTRLVVFETPVQKGFIVPADGMKEDLESELSLYEGPE